MNRVGLSAFAAAALCYSLASAVSPPIPDGFYSIGNVGVANTNFMNRIPGCGVYLGQQNCTSTLPTPNVVVNLDNSTAGSPPGGIDTIIWSLVNVRDDIYNIYAMSRNDCGSPFRYLSCPGCPVGDFVDLYSFDDGSKRQEWQLIPANTTQPGSTPYYGTLIFNIKVSGGRDGCSPYISSTSCFSPSTGNSQPPTIVMDAADNGFGYERWFFTQVPAPATLTTGNYTIQNIGTGYENDPTCNTYLGATNCCGTSVQSVGATDPSAVWTVTFLHDNVFTIQNLNKLQCGDPYNYLSTASCGSNLVDLWFEDDNSGRQEFYLFPAGGFNIFDVVVAGGRDPCNKYLSSTVCAAGPYSDEYYTDDNSGRQRWRFVAVPSTTAAPHAASANAQAPSAALGAASAALPSPSEHESMTAG